MERVRRVQEVKTPLEMIGILPGNAQAEIEPFLRLAEELRCKAEIRYANSNKYWRCVYKMRKPAKVLFAIECTEEWWRIKAVLSGMAQYLHRLSRCSQHLQANILGAYECHHCNGHCKGANPYVFQGTEYRKCIGCSYYFQDLGAVDWHSVEELIREDAKFLQGFLQNPRSLFPN